MTVLWALPHTSASPQKLQVGAGRQGSAVGGSGREAPPASRGGGGFKHGCRSLGLRLDAGARPHCCQAVSGGCVREPRARRGRQDHVCLSTHGSQLLQAVQLGSQLDSQLGLQLGLQLHPHGGGGAAPPPTHQPGQGMHGLLASPTLQGNRLQLTLCC